MASRSIACAGGAVALGVIVGCTSSSKTPFDIQVSMGTAHEVQSADTPESIYRQDAAAPTAQLPSLLASSSQDDFVRYALYNSPRVEAAYQLWRAASERLPQVSALPDPKVTFGFFLDEVETRTGPQQARIGVQQAFPWPGQLGNREDAASKAATAAWRRFEAIRLEVAERVVSTLHDLAYLDAATAITQENLELLSSFEQVLRARYRVGSGSHPELIRVQVELGQLEDRLAQLRTMRPSFVAELNASLNRAPSTETNAVRRLPGRVVSIDVDALIEIATRSNPTLLALDEEVEEQRILAEVARQEGLPTFAVGLDYIFTDDAIDPTIPESGDDPILLSFGLSVPLWRDKYDAGVRESIARRLAVSHQRVDESNRISAAIQRAWFEHTDANRRVGLYENTLIPKAEESLRASLAGFRAGDASFLDLLDTERTLLEFAVAAERARADRGKALARLNSLVGEPVPTKPAQNAAIPPDGNEVEP